MNDVPGERPTIPVDRVAAFVRELIGAGVSTPKLADAARRARDDARPQDAQLAAAVALARRLAP